MRRWLAFLCISAAVAGCSSRDEVAEVDAALAAVQQEQALLAAALANAVADARERRDTAVLAPAAKMGDDLDRLRKVTGELRAVSVKEMRYYREVIERRGDPRAALQRMGYMDVAIATAERLVVEVRGDVKFAGDAATLERTRQFDASLANLGKAVGSIRAILKVQREKLLKS